mgnify:CR=1 FL=1
MKSSNIYTIGFLTGFNILINIQYAKTTNQKVLDFNRNNNRMLLLYEYRARKVQQTNKKKHINT